MFTQNSRWISARWKALTVLRNHREGDNTAGLLDELDNVVVRELNDWAAVDRWDTIADMQQATSVGGTALDNAADLVRNHWKHSWRANAAWESKMRARRTVWPTRKFIFKKY